jgi:large subunit ribosomal protein L13
MDYRIDAKNKVLGRLASEVSLILQGKKNPAYQPNKVSHDRVFISNCAQIAVTGDKMKGKVYHRHTGYVGHIKDTRLEEKFAKDAKTVLRDTVRKMLPKNTLARERLKHLKFVD